jgi:DNA-binding MarR family transcriptional regulator
MPTSKHTSPGPTVIQHFLGSTHAFSSAIDDIVERRLARGLAPGPLTLPQLKLLKLVALADARTLHDVAVFLGVTDAAASRAVERLVQRRLLHRASGKPDLRKIHLSLTKAAERLLSMYERERARTLQELFGDLDAGDRTHGAADRLAVG